MVEDAGIKDLDLINQTRDNINISHFYPEELSKYRETRLFVILHACLRNTVSLNERECNC